MSRFISGLAASIEGMLEYREALGFAKESNISNLINFDYYCAEKYPEKDTITKDMALGWIHRELERTRPNINAKSGAIRLLGNYITASGRDAYIIPKDYVSRKTTPTPYIFTDAELEALFNATDTSLKAGSLDALVAPVMFRLIYTCGLRPNEGRELECANVDLDTGEIFVTKSKRKKERLVVMSDDMLMLCKKYVEKRRALGIDSMFFFANADGGSFAESKLDRLFKKCWANANPTISVDILPSVRVYDLRHRFASAVLNLWLDEGRDLYVMLPYLSAYMGHKSMSETAHYIHILPENLSKSVGVDWATLESLVPEVRA